MQNAEIAQVCHEANRALQTLQDPETTGVAVSPAWADDTDAQRASVISGVEGILAGATPEESHEAWCEYKRAEGWVYGSTKDLAAKTHPCLVPYADLPADQRTKDHLFFAIVTALAEHAS